MHQPLPPQRSADPSPPPGFPRVVIVGAGISGICLGVQLKRAGIESFTILEKSQAVGGTWHDNVYPGCGCDIPSILYSFSFAPKTNWTRRYSPQPEILQYFQDCAERFGLMPHVRFGQAVTRAEFDEAAGVWRIETEEGDEIEADVFVAAVGQLNRPRVPQIEGLETFAGAAFHSARWNRQIDLKHKRVAVVGNGASAIQLIPKLAEQAAEVAVFQRTPNWIARRKDYAYPRWAHAAMRYVPGAAWLHRAGNFLLHESRIELYRRRSGGNLGFTAWLRRGMRRRLPKRLHAAAIPNYPAGCKRVLLSNDYLESLARDNVQLVTDPIRGVEPAGIRTAVGLTEVDAIVFATGFESTRFLYPMAIVGRSGLSLDDAWGDRPRTLLGMMSPGFPNFFMLYGPNTNLGHNSIIFMVECQVNYVLQLLKSMRGRGDQSIEVRDEAVEAFDRKLQKRLSKTVWQGYVDSWYKNAQGNIVNNWSGAAVRYWWQTRLAKERHFVRRAGSEFGVRNSEFGSSALPKPLNAEHAETQRAAEVE